VYLVTSLQPVLRPLHNEKQRYMLPDTVIKSSADTQNMLAAKKKKSS